jgi:ABC-type phosphate transport system auxiliary subunit
MGAMRQVFRAVADITGTVRADPHSLGGDVMPDDLERRQQDLTRQIDRLEREIAQADIEGQDTTVMEEQLEKLEIEREKLRRQRHDQDFGFET